MTVRDLYEFQQLTFRAYMQNVMFFATLPYHLAQEPQQNRAREGASQPARDFRRKDIRWLR
jgi:hypothetical protein